MRGHGSSDNNMKGSQYVAIRAPALALVYAAVFLAIGLWIGVSHAPAQGVVKPADGTPPIAQFIGSGI
jgi:hypothetical protein